MRLDLLSLALIGAVSTAVAFGCGAPAAEGTPGPAQTPNAGRDPAIMDPADDPRSGDGPPSQGVDGSPGHGVDPGRTPMMATAAVGGAFTTTGGGPSGSGTTGPTTGAGPTTGSGPTTASGAGSAGSGSTGGFR
jgi:hypothetical protein